VQPSFTRAVWDEPPYPRERTCGLTSLPARALGTLWAARPRGHGRRICGYPLRWLSAQFWTDRVV